MSQTKMGRTQNCNIERLFGNVFVNNGREGGPQGGGSYWRAINDQYWLLRIHHYSKHRINLGLTLMMTVMKMMLMM